jgi:serine protease AprX
MATPLVAGCCAVLRETLVKNNGIANPTAALVKAVLLNGAVEMLGQYSPSEAKPAPNTDFGFGRVNVKNSVIAKGSPLAGCGQSDESQDFDDDTPPLILRIPVPAKVESEEGPRNPTFKVTLVWSDPAGANLQNDLDLTVTAPGGTKKFGNMGAEPDRVNNVEQVIWKDIPAGTVEVKIEAFRITVQKQPFAWAWKIY